jgi:hypothetical protein
MEEGIMRAPILTASVAILTLVTVGPLHAAGEGECERALAKTSAKFVSAALKSAQRCLMQKQAGRLPASACRLTADSTGSRRTDAGLAHAESNLRNGLRACGDRVLAGMGFNAACDDPTPADGFTRADLQHCIAHTHMGAVQALVSVQFPQGTDDCGNGVVDVDEECDPVATPSECDTDETCGVAGSEDACTCIFEGEASCGNGAVEEGEECDPTATPTGCGEGSVCGAFGDPGECTCSGGSPESCTGECSPACGAGQNCICECSSGVCGNGTRETGEECDPMANPSGCAVNLICGAPGTATQCECTSGGGGQCGNGTLDAGEACDPALPNTCDPGEVCLSDGPMACMCGAPPSNCGNAVIEWGEACDPAASPTGCQAGENCAARGGADQCTCVPGGGGNCGNGVVDAGEACDPAATPTGCDPGQTCSGQCSCSGATPTCGNGTVDTGEACDPAANPTGCPAGMTCGTTCTCTGGGGGECCEPAQIVTMSSAGSLRVSTLPEFPFPAGVATTVDLGPADADCKHPGIVPSGGFSVPVFCIPALGFTSAVIPKGCEAGGSDGSGTVWDGAAASPDPNVARVGDTSDGTCNPAGQACNTSPSGAGGNTQGDINTTRGGSPVAGGAVHTQLDIPVNSVTWSDLDGACPDEDGRFDEGSDTIITNFDFILSPTTGASSATFTDLNADGCKRAGNGPDSYDATGEPAPGPCCVVGQSTTVVATGLAFTGGAPLFDLSFRNVTPATISACNPAPATLGSCTLTTDPCLD